MSGAVQQVIVATGPAVVQFRWVVDSLGGFREISVEEVVSRIVAVLNAEGFWIGALEIMAAEYVLDGAKLSVADEKILVDTQTLRAEVVRLGVAIRDQFAALHLLTASGGYGYFYNQLLGDDLVVSRYPVVETRDDDNPGGVGGCW